MSGLAAKTFWYVQVWWWGGYKLTLIIWYEVRKGECATVHVTQYNNITQTRKPQGPQICQKVSPSNWAIEWYTVRKADKNVPA